MAAYLQDILKLSKEDRLRIVQFILDSIRFEEKPEDPAISEEWKQELDRRSKLYQEGKTQLHTWEEVETFIKERK